MTRRSSALAILAAACALTLAGCDRHRPLPSDPHANEPGSPGTGNPVTQVQPTAPDTQPGGSSAGAGSLPHVGSSGSDALPGVTGKGTSDASTPPGVGLNGGVGSGSASVTGSTSAGTGTSAPMGAGAAPQGSTNTTTGSSFGNRP